MKQLKSMWRKILEGMAVLTLCVLVVFGWHWYQTYQINASLSGLTRIIGPDAAEIRASINPVRNVITITVAGLPPEGSTASVEFPGSVVSRLVESLGPNVTESALNEQAAWTLDLYALLRPYRQRIEIVTAEPGTANKIAQATLEWQRDEEERRRKEEERLREQREREEARLQAQREQEGTRRRTEQIHREQALLLNREAKISGLRPPCPNGWDEGCERAWQYRENGPSTLDPFEPYARTDQLATVNARAPRFAPCTGRHKISVSDWPTVDSSVALKVFARKVQRNGAADSTWAVLRVDPEAVEAAIQVARAAGTIEDDEIDRLRSAALRALFKPNARTFILMHNSGSTWRVARKEPYLISERQGEGKLVGISATVAVGFSSDQVGMLMLEDRVCDDDLSYSLNVAFEYSCKLQVLWFRPYDSMCSESRRFNFGSNDNIARVMASVYKSYVPEYQKAQKAQERPPGFAGSDIVSVVGMAINLVQLILQLIK